METTTYNNTPPPQQSDSGASGVIVAIGIIIVVGVIAWIAYDRGAFQSSPTIITPPGPTQIVPVGFPNPIPTPVPNPVPNPIPTPVPTPGSFSVAIRNFDYAPSSVTVRRGTTVVWTNFDSEAHTVTVTSGAGPSSGTLSQGEKYSFTFNTTGTFDYYCTLHPSMTGRVIVTP